MARTSKMDESYSAKVKAVKTFRNIICIFFCVMSIFPFYTMIINATHKSAVIVRGLKILPGGELINNFKGMIERTQGSGTPIQKAFLHSMMISAPATLMQVYFATMTAYGLSVYRFKLKNLAWSFIMAIMMIPAQVSIIGFMSFMMKLNLYNTYVPLIIPCIAAPTTVYFMKQFMVSALPVEIIEAARIDGSNEFSTFNRIALPLMKPAMATQGIFAFIGSWNNLYTPSMLVTDIHKFTLPMFIQGLRSDSIRTDYGFVYLGLTLTVLPLIVVYCMFSKSIIAGVALGGVKE